MPYARRSAAKTSDVRSRRRSTLQIFKSGPGRRGNAAPVRSCVMARIVLPLRGGFITCRKSAIRMANHVARSLDAAGVRLQRAEAPGQPQPTV